ncbi:hypothetical protein BJX70DRAFT_401831 [Aspergillus crustosus]
MAALLVLGGLFTILVYILPLRRLPFWCGMLAIVENAAALSAPVLGGLLTQSLGWRWCFYLNLPIGAVAGLMALFLFEDPKPSDTSISLTQKILRLDPLSTTLFPTLSHAGTNTPGARRRSSPRSSPP